MNNVHEFEPVPYKVFVGAQNSGLGLRTLTWIVLAVVEIALSNRKINIKRKRKSDIQMQHVLPGSHDAFVV